MYDRLELMNRLRTSLKASSIDYPAQNVLPNLDKH
jgi:hypothetical protein